jgi:3-oxoacyl-[acyl-carrier protein] reductase
VNLGLEGRVALVTGAAGGLGPAVCRLLAAEGARVVASDLDGDRIEAAGAAEVAALVVTADVTRGEEAERLVAETVAALGGLDILVAAAGVYQGTPVEAIAEDEWDRLQEVNVKGTFLTARAAIAVMKEAGRGSVVTLASIAGQVGGIQSGAGYATSKAAVLGLTKALARHAGPHGIRVNAVSPGYIEAGMSLGMQEADRLRTVEATPLRRAGTAEEVAAAVVWLASDGASFVTGSHLDVNGGLFMA